MPINNQWGTQLTAMDVLPSAADTVNLQNSVMQNQMNQMKLQEAMKQQAENNQFEGKLTQAFKSASDPKNPSVNDPNQPGQSTMKYQPTANENPMDFIDRGMQQAKTDGDVKTFMKFQQMKTQMDTGLAKAKAIGDIIKAVGGTRNFKRLQPSLASISPDLAKIDLAGIEETPDGYTKPILNNGTPTGNSIVYFDDGKGETKAQIVKDQHSEPKTDFQTFYSAMKQQGKSDMEISTAWHKMKTDEQKLVAQIRIPAMTATPTPGISFDRRSGKYYTNVTGPDGTSQRVELTSDQVKGMNLDYKMDTPSNDIKVMKQSAPSVLNLANSIENDIKVNMRQLGPAASRWNEFWSGKVGAPNPQFRKLQTDVGLLTTRLMKMHVGARGGVEIMKHFGDMLAAGKQSPENLQAALQAIKEYAQEVNDMDYTGASKGAKNPTTGNKTDLRSKYGY